MRDEPTKKATESLQDQVSELYKLTCETAAEYHINLGPSNLQATKDGEATIVDLLRGTMSTLAETRNNLLSIRGHLRDIQETVG